MNKIAFLLCSFLLLGSSVTHAATTCSYDKAAMLGLDEEEFDQDLSGGWRAVANTSGCELAAADLLAAYRTQHPKVSAVLAWHEGQLRAMAGQYERAIPLLNQDRKPPGQDLAGWNYYVDATLAFLRQDKPALLNARHQLAAVPYAEGIGLPPLKNGYFEVPGQPGHPATHMRWPPNIDVVDGLVACFGKSYSEANEKSCRPPSP